MEGINIAMGCQKEKEMISFYLIGNNQVETAKKFNISQCSIWRTLKKNSISPRNVSISLTRNQQREMVDLYTEGKSIKEVGNNFNISFWWTREILKRNGVILRLKGNPAGKKVCPEGMKKLVPYKEKIIKDYLAGETSIVIGEEHNVSALSIISLLRKNGIEIRKRGFAGGETHHNWKGGVSRDKKRKSKLKIASHNKKVQQDPFYKIRSVLRSRISCFLRRNKIRKTHTSNQYLGADFDTVKLHLEPKFLPEMTWKNHGKIWHIDHIIPLASAKTEEELIKLFHYTNLQPLWARDNWSKGAKILEAA